MGAAASVRCNKFNLPLIVLTAFFLVLALFSCGQNATDEIEDDHWCDPFDLLRCGPCRFTPPCKCNVSCRRVGINEQTALSNVFVKLKAPQLGDDVHSLARILARQKISDDAVALQKRNGEASPEVLFFLFWRKRLAWM